MNVTQMLAFVDCRPVADEYTGPMPVTYRPAQYDTTYRDWLVPASRLAEYFPPVASSTIGVVEEMWPAGEGPLKMRFAQRPCERMADSSYGPTYTWDVSRLSIKLWMDGTYPFVEVYPSVGRGESEWLQFVLVRLTADGKVEQARDGRYKKKPSTVEYCVGQGWEDDVATFLAAVTAVTA